jgi:hypothetical protein
MIAGFSTHGDDVSHDRSADFDIACFWGHRKRVAIESCKRRRRRYLVMERAYLGDRFRWVSLGFDGLNGSADFNNANVPDDRWSKYWADSVKPWKSGGDYALIIGQIQGDAALRGMDINRWAQMAVDEARKHYERVVWRPHPLARVKANIRHAETQEGSLDDALAGASVVITYNSNTAVDAVMAGVPAVAMGPYSMAEAVTSRTIGEPLYTGDRDAWGAKLAYCQWLPEEIESGEAWAHLRGVALGNRT